MSKIKIESVKLGRPKIHFCQLQIFDALDMITKTLV